MESWREIQGKLLHDPLFHLFPHYQHHGCSFDTTSIPTNNSTMIRDSRLSESKQYIFFPGPIVVGAGPSGLAVAACLKEKNIPCMLIERSSCIASLWQLKTYDRLCLHLPKHFCELPLMPFPSSYPTYPSKQQFVAYLEAYANYFDIQPLFNQRVISAEYDSDVKLWKVSVTTTTRTLEDQKDKNIVNIEYMSKWLIVATGENAEEIVPNIEGMQEFKGPVLHTSLYKSGDMFSGKRVLIIGCGNSGMEVCLDLCNHNARPCIAVRDTVHILPREIGGCSTFGISMWLLRWLSIRTVDHILLFISWLMLGATEQYGLPRPQLGPLELKSLSGKTPVLDVGTLAKIKSGDIKVRRAVKRLTKYGAEFVDGSSEEFDAIVLATGYKSNVPSWLKDKEFFSDKDGLPKRPFPNCWKGEKGLYAVGFTKRGLMGTSMDARRIAHDIEKCWMAKQEQHIMSLSS